MKIKFCGDPLTPGSDPDQVKCFGIVFPLGKAVEVKDKAVQERLLASSHFEKVGTETKNIQEGAGLV